PGRPSPDAGGSGEGVRGDPGADPADRIEDAVEASPSLAVAEAPRLPRVAAPWGPPGGALRQIHDRIGGGIFLPEPISHRRAGPFHPLLDDREAELGALGGHALGPLG